MLNDVKQIGYLVGDPVSRTTPRGFQVVSFGLALSSRNKNTEKRPGIITVECWNQIGEIAQNYGKKGKMVLVEGELVVDTWNEGEQKKKNIYIRASHIRFFESSGIKEEKEEEKEMDTNQHEEDEIIQAMKNFKFEE